MNFQPAIYSYVCRCRTPKGRGGWSPCHDGHGREPAPIQRSQGVSRGVPSPASGAPQSSTCRALLYCTCTGKTASGKNCIHTLPAAVGAWILSRADSKRARAVRLQDDVYAGRAVRRSNISRCWFSLALSSCGDREACHPCICVVHGGHVRQSRCWDGICR